MRGKAARLQRTGALIRAYTTRTDNERAFACNLIWQLDNEHAWTRRLPLDVWFGNIVGKSD